MRKIALVLLAAAALVIGWSALWGFAAHEAGVRVDDLLAAEAEQGRDWTCPDRRIGGFPFALTIRCLAPTYSGQAGGQHVHGALGAVLARVGIAAPSRVALTLEGPFTYATSDGATSVEGRWHSLDADLSPLPDIRTLRLRGTAVAVSGLFVGEHAGGEAAALDVTAMLEPGADPVLGFAMTLEGASVPQVNELLGGTATADASLSGRLHKADVTAGTPEQLMERWRLAGGKIDIDDFSASRAGARLTATGTLGLDERHRLQGRLNADFFGLAPILRRYGIGTDLAAVGSLLGALFGGSAKPAPPGALALPITLGGGHIGIGPVTTGIELKPLY